MKKIILLLLPFIVLVFGSRSLAYMGPDNVDYEYKWEGNVFNGNYVFYSHYPFTYCTNYTTGDYYYLLTGVKDGEGNVKLISFNIRSGTYDTTVNVVEYPPNTSVGFTDVVGTLNGGTFANSWNWAVPLSSLSGTAGFTTKQECYEYITTPNIDFDNPYYDPLLSVPEVEIKYNMADYSTGNVPVLPISIKLTNADSGYYVQAVMVNYMPSTVAVKYQDYDALMSHKFQQHDLIPAEMLKISSDLTSDDLGDLAVNAWSQDVVSYPVSNVIFTNQIGTDSGAVAAYQNMIDLYTNARKVGLFYGNNTELYFRYFYIDDNDKFVVSAWRTWSSSYSNSFGLAMPSYYKTYSSASGYENTDNNTSIVISPTSQPNVVNPSNNYGKKTGSPININIGSNVPNYPDYPTIATYNTDNLLVNALDTAKQLPDFFTSSIAIFNGMFEGLLPEPFWGIIMTGFLFSIVIMIIKVL